MKNLLPFIIFLVNLSFASAQWQKTNGPFHTKIKAFAKSEANLYAMGETDGVFVSSNNGTTWTGINNGLPAFEIYYALAVDTTKLFLGTNSGIYISTNVGSEWVQTNNGLPENVRVYAILVDGNNVYAGTDRGLFKSDNSGDSWTAADNGIPGDIAVGALTKSDSNLFAGTSQGVFLSSNESTNWTAMNNGLPSTIYFYSFARMGSNLFAGTSDGVYLSSDAGNIWSAMNNGLSESLIFCLEANGTNLYAGSPTALFVSSDIGVTWEIIKDGPTELVHTSTSTTAILADGTDIFAGGNDGIFHSSDDGATWAKSNSGLPYTGLYTLASNGNRVYAGTDKGLYVTDDNGGNWDRKFSYITSTVKARGSNVYIGSIPGLIYVSNDDGTTWTQSTGFSDNGQEVIAVAGSTVFARYNVSLFNEGTGYISTDNGATFNKYDYPYTIFASTDADGLFAVGNTVVVYNGGPWLDASPVITDSVYTLAVSNNGFIVGTDGGVIHNSYNGVIWTKVAFGLESEKVTDLAVDGSNVYACTSNNDIFLSTDNGNNWTAITDNFSDTIIGKNLYGTNATQLLVNNTHIFVGGQEGIWARPLSELVSTREQPGDPQFTIYPNPTRGRFRVSGYAIDKILVYNALGALIYSEPGQNAHFREIDLSAFPNGVYWIRVSSGGEKYAKKVVIQ